MAKMTWRTTEEIEQEEQIAKLEAEHFEKKEKAEKAILHRMAQDYILSEDLDDEEKDLFTALFELWTPGIEYSVGEKVVHEGNVYEVIQGHTAQADWKPSDVPALFKEIYQKETSDGETVVSEWKQPLGGHDSYQVGDLVSFDGTIYESTVDNNVWQPGVYGWTEVEVI